MKVSNGVPVFKGVSEHGKEPQSVKQGLVDSASFKLHGKRYAAWEGDLVTLENANRAFNQATLIHRVESKSGVTLEQTTNKRILKNAEEAFNQVLKSLAHKVKNHPSKS